MEKETYLSFEETEQLCRLYMECQLSILEEAELHYVLGKLPYSSPVIDEARTLMAISLSCAMDTEADASAIPKKNRKTLKRKILLFAASVTLLIACGIPTFLYFNSRQDFYCQVFTNGKEVSRDKALIIAESELERIDSFFENMNSIESEQQEKIESL